MQERKNAGRHGQIFIQSSTLVVSAILHFQWKSGCCRALYTFDDRRFARRAQRLDLAPKVMVPIPVAEEIK
jgi:hypothetical protein